MLAYRPGVSSLTFSAYGRYPTTKSLETFGRALVDFFDWCEVRAVDWREVDYTHHLVNRYQSEMLKGAWSASGRPLAPRTINARVQESCNYLTWCAQKGYRRPFSFLTAVRQITVNSASRTHGQTLHIQSRIGRVRPAPTNLKLPTDCQVVDWLKGIEIECGHTKALMCELIVKTGVRREEACQWRVDTLPLSRANWDVVGNSVTVSVKYGAKGQKYPDAYGNLYGPERHIRISLELAERIAHYRDEIRFKSRALFARAASNASERLVRSRKAEQRLFLSEATGKPISAQVLYIAWVDSSRLPYRGWSPHLGRHYWACKTMLEAIAQRVENAGNTPNRLEPTWITGIATDALMLLVRPQLGHVSQETSNIYLVWLANAYIKAQIDDDYAMMLDDFPGPGRESRDA